MGDHDWQKDERRGEKGSYSDQKYFLEKNEVDKMSVLGDWASPQEYFNERGMGSNALASRSLKFLKYDFLPSQVVPSRAERFPVSNMDAYLYKNFSRQSLNGGKNLNILPILKLEVRRRGSSVDDHSSSGSFRNASRALTPLRKNHSALSSLTPVRSVRLPDLVSVKKLLRKEPSDYSKNRKDRVNALNGLSNPFDSESNKAPLDFWNSRRSSSRSSILSHDSALRREHKLSGATPSFKCISSINQTTGMLEGIHNDSRHSMRRNSISLIPSEEQSCSDVVWRTKPTPKKRAARNTVSKIGLPNRSFNVRMGTLYYAGKRRDSNILSSRSKTSNGSVVWTRFPTFLHKHPAAPHPRSQRVSNPKSNAKLSFRAGQHANIIGGNSQRNSNRTYNKSDRISSMKAIDMGSNGSLRSGFRSNKSLEAYRTGSPSSCISGFSDMPLTNDLKSKSSSHSLGTTVVSSVVVEGHKSTVEPYDVANRKEKHEIASVIGVPTKGLLKTAINSAGLYDAKKGSQNLGGQSGPPSRRESGASYRKIQTFDAPTITTGTNGYRLSVEERGAKNKQKTDEYRSALHTGQVKVEKMQDLLPSKRTVSSTGARTEAYRFGLSRNTIGSRSNLGNRSRVIRKPKPSKVNKSNEVSLRLLRSIYLGVQMPRRHRSSLLDRMSTSSPLSRPSPGLDCKIKPYFDHSGINSKEKTKENVGKKSNRIESFIKSNDPFNYLLRLHGFWGETNYY